MHLEDYDQQKKILVSEIFDRWILSKLQKLIQESTNSFDNYEYAKTKSAVENFFWHTVCDYYLEIIKDRFYNAPLRGQEAKLSAQKGLYDCLLSVLKLIAPIMPHITEEIYQLFFVQKESSKSIHLSSWPSYHKELIDEKAELVGDLGLDIIDTVRKYKSEHKLSMKEELKELIVISEEQDFQKMIMSIEKDLRAVLNVQTILFKGQTSLESTQFQVKIGLSP